MKRFFLSVSFAILFSFLLLTFGCYTTSYYKMLEPVTVDTKKYQVMEITDVENYVPQVFSQESCNRLKKRLVAATKEKTQRFKEIFEVSELTKDVSASDVLVFKPTVVGFEPGSGAKRFFVGFGAGKALLEMKLDLFDKSSGEKIGATILTSEAMMAGTNVFRPMAQQFVVFIDRFIK